MWQCRKLNDITTFLETKKVSDLELQRLDADLHTLYERLINREYLETDFSQKNKYNIPERTQEFFKYLSDYCKNARTWEAILQKFEMAKISRIANLCPGRAPKIELALYYLGYQGVIEIIDKDTKAMDQIQNFMHLFKYEYKIQKRVTDIFAAKKSTPYELIIANHIIDDTFLFFYAKRKKIGIEDIYTNESKLVQLWETVLKEDTTAIQEAFLEELSNFLICISEKGTIVIFSQYQSYIEWLLHLDSAVKLNIDLMWRLREILMKKGFEENRSLVVKSFWKFKGYFKPQEFFLLQKNHG